MGYKKITYKDMARNLAKKRPLKLPRIDKNTLKKLTSKK
jgi:hypothetical protein